jgi:CRP-like cAMP-binding protein
MEKTAREALAINLKSYVPFSDQELESILNVFHLRIYKKKDILAPKGKIVDSAFFIFKGSLRLYFDEKGVEVTGNISTENEFLSSHESFFSKLPSKYNVESIEDSVVLEIKTNDFIQEAVKNPKVFQVAMKILEHRLTKARETIEMLVTLNPQERYLKILKESPNWLHRFPHHVIASYMGISPVSLSRIRKRILN